MAIIINDLVEAIVTKEAKTQLKSRVEKYEGFIVSLEDFKLHTKLKFINQN